MEIKPACHQILNTALDLIESFASIFNEQLICLMWWLHNYEYELVLYLGHIGSNAMIFNYCLSRNCKKKAAKLENTVNYSLSTGLKSLHPIYLCGVPEGTEPFSSGLFISISHWISVRKPAQYQHTQMYYWVTLSIKRVKSLILNVQ